MKKASLGLLLLLTVGACGNYSMSVNERVVYTPPGIFTDFQVEDLSLQRCLDAMIAEEAVRSANTLHSLLCPAKGISMLNGLELFKELRVLGLEDNRIQSLQALNTLTDLSQLNLANNKITDISALYTLKKLSYLNLSGNPNLNCQQVKNIRLEPGAKLIAPRHCN